jgi:hypothetical protein
MRILLLFHNCNANFEIRGDFFRRRAIGKDREHLARRFKARTDARQVGHSGPFYSCRATGHTKLRWRRGFNVFVREENHVAEVSCYLARVSRRKSAIARRNDMDPQYGVARSPLNRFCLRRNSRAFCDRPGLFSDEIEIRVKRRMCNSS